MAEYDIRPELPLAGGRILAGYEALAEAITRTGARRIAIDGYQGVLWAELRAALEDRLGLPWFDTAQWLLPRADIERRIAPSLGGDDPLFGRLYQGDLTDFFQPSTALAEGIVYGPGAALFGQPDLLVYVDVPKDEIQRRLRAGTVSNLGTTDTSYKRAYFVDWPALNRHKARLLPRIHWFVDAQKPPRPTAIEGRRLRAALEARARSWFRAKPWFYPGPWGGQYMKRHFPGLEQDVPNYAWSFELIVPENGLLFGDGAESLECSFDLLMYQAHKAVLGRAAERFGADFPIRFDYLDTMAGGNLSVQVHPRPEYIRREFGERFTQDESYYIVTCEPGARVHLGLRDGTDPAEFRAALERSAQHRVELDVPRFVNSVPAQQHDLFLIPNGTVHGSGAGNLVLEISSTPYIYTFKIYDWLRDRPLNIARAWQNICFDRQESYTNERLVCHPRTLRADPGWRELFLGTHEAIFYEVHRYEIETAMEAETDGRCHVLNLVEGAAVLLQTAAGEEARFGFGETFVVPAAAGSYRLSALEGRPCKVVLAFVK